MKAADEPVVIFLHVPKACGTTLRKLLERWCAREQVYAVHAQPRAEALAEIAALSRKTPPGVRLIVGHAPFGLHEALAQPARYITILRDPIERLISSYHYIRRNPKHRLHAAMQRGEISLSQLSQRHANLQTRYLAGSLEIEPDAAALEHAQNNIRQHFAVVGLADRFEESALLIHRAFGRKLLPFASENIRPRRLLADTLAADELRNLRVTHELDFELCKFARRRFEEQVAQENAAFPRQVRNLRRANRVVNFAARALPGFVRK